jgi:hypothetical protein
MEKTWIGALRGVLALVAAICACLALPALASAAGTGSIEGTVVEAAGTHQPIEGMSVCAYSESTEDEACAKTSSTGAYDIKGLANATDYIVYFTGELCSGSGLNEKCTKPYVSQVWENTSEYSKAKKIVVSGIPVTGIDASMAEGGQIKGRVVKVAGGAPIDGMYVCASSEEGEYYEECGTTDASGEYVIEGLPTGAGYIVGFTGFVCGGSGEGECGSKYVLQYWDHKLAFNSATPVSVTAPATTPNIDAEMAEGGRIEGVVTAASIEKAAIRGMRVCAAGTLEGEKRLSCAVTGEHGEYVLEALASASYTVEFSGEICSFSNERYECAKPYAKQFYDGKAIEREADAVDVTAPLAATGIDASMLESAPKQPAALTAPVLSGSPSVGAALSCSAGTWSNNPTSLSYAWLRGGTVIAGQVGATYTVQAEDQGQTLTCQVTASNGAGSAVVSSNSLSVPVPSPPPPPPPPPPPAPKAGTAVMVGNGLVEHGTGELLLKCDGEGACKGTVKLVDKIVVKIRKHGKVKRKTRTVTVGEASFSIAAGGKETLDVHLTGKGKTLLAKAGKHGLRVALEGTDVKSRKVLLKVGHRGHSRPAKHKRKH